MPISAEQLNIILKARDKEFTKAMDRNQKRIERFAKQSQKSLSASAKSFDMIGAAAKRIAPLLAASFSVSAIQGMVNTTAEIGVMADIAGVSAEKFQELSFAASNFGIQQEKMSDILKDVNDKFGDYVQTGAGPLADFFDNIAPKVGLTADAFADLSSDQKLGRYISALEAANLSQSEMTFFLEALASDATALQGVFANNGAELDRFSQKLRDAGGVMSNELIAEARTAKEELNAAATIIKANLTVAFAELIPLIAAGAEGFANLVTNIATAIDAVDRFINPQSDLEVATDNVVSAMADEIRQSQQLEAALGRSTAMSVDAAKKKLEEARSRHENAKAAIAEQRALALGSEAYSDLLSEIETAQDAARSVGFPSIDASSVRNAQAFEDAQLYLVQLRQEQQRMLEADQELSEQFSQTEENISKLEAALENASGGMVSFGESIVNPIEASDRLSGSVGRASATTQDLIDNLVKTGPAIETLGLNADQLGGIMSNVESSMESAFMSMIDGTESAKGAFKSMASEIIKELYRVLVVQRLVSAITGAFGGPGMTTGTPLQVPSGSGASLLPPSFSGGGYTGNGARSGGLDGKGGFMAMMHPRESVIDHTKGQGAGGVVVNQTINVSTGVQQTVRTEIKSLMPQIAESAKSAVVDAKRRGGSYGRSFA